MPRSRLTLASFVLTSPASPRSFPKVLETAFLPKFDLAVYIAPLAISYRSNRILPLGSIKRLKLYLIA
ncbi:hypothetical protein KC356_g187 [Hortaea werneckii]|nr:hypothetical protein KC356_g187 [Hortaea werneckii]